MPGTIKITVQMSAENGTFSLPPTQRNLNITQTNKGAVSGIQNITTAANGELLSIGDIAAANVGYLLLQNLDAANYVEFGYDNAGTILAPFRLKAGEIALVRLKPSQNLRIIANTAAVDVYYVLLAD